MKIIQKKADIADMILGSQGQAEGGAPRFLAYCVATRCEGGVLLHNIMTRELLLLEGGEADMLDVDNLNASRVLGQGDAELFRYLRENWYIVPQGHDDKALCFGLRAVVRQVCEGENAGRIRSFVILSTSACNARCYYCYERGVRPEHMTRETALGVVDFIRRSCGGGKVSLNWFGGEPLFNTEPMDIITDGLAEAGIEFRSSMISNGYLFDDALVQRAKERWRLGSVQITLDGTEEVYNATKAYIYKDGGSPFRRVTDNIERLLGADIYVSMRLNLSGSNFDDLMELAGYIVRRYGGYKHFDAYSRYVYDEHAGRPHSGDPETLNRQMRQLGDKLHGAGALKVWSVALRGDVRYCACMVDNDASVVIQTNGNLSKCQHFIKSNVCGNIREGITDAEEIARCKRPAVYAEVCGTCPFLPECIRTETCDYPYMRDCERFATVRAERFMELRRAMQSRYGRYKEEQCGTNKNKQSNEENV